MHSGVDEFPNVTESDLRAGDAGRCASSGSLCSFTPSSTLGAEVTLNPIRASTTAYLHRARAPGEDEAIACSSDLCRAHRLPGAHRAPLVATSVAISRAARAEGLPVTAETCPHYLCLDAKEIPDGATHFKCAPPIRERENREALWRALAEGSSISSSPITAPARPRSSSPSGAISSPAWGGIASLQLGLSDLWTEAARGATLVDLAHWMSAAPAVCRATRSQGAIAPGYDADLVVWDPDETFEVSPEIALLPSQNLALHGPALAGRVHRTYLRGELVDDDGHHPRRPPGPVLLTPTSSIVNDTSRAGFTGLIDLASETLGGKALVANDDFFAGKENLLKPRRAVFIEGKFTERREVDGRLGEPPQDEGPVMTGACIELGAPGEVLGFDVDTSAFSRQPSPLRLDRRPLRAAGYPARRARTSALGASSWNKRPCAPARKTCSRPARATPVSHVRLNMFPDGGIARFRVYGRVHAPRVGDTTCSMTRPARTFPPASPRVSAIWPPSKMAVSRLACSDAFFGPMNNLLLPGRAENMGGGWETRRRRGPGFDWIIVKLAARGMAKLIEVDTNHFCGNFPDRCSIDAIDAPGARITELIAHQGWTSLLSEKKLAASQRHFFGDLPSLGAASHLRLNIFPDGGVSRLRVWGVRDA